jgi:DNA polymerase III delta prime subunit
MTNQENQENQENQASLIDLIRAEEFTEEEFIKCFSETRRERDVIEKLKGSGAHLLEGPRGLGKSSLLRKTELELDDEFQKTRSLGVYVNFKASLRVQPNYPGLEFNPFLCWVTAKILDALYKKCKRLSIIQSNLIIEKYRRLLSVGPSWSPASLERTIQDLQSLAIASTSDAKHKIEERLSNASLEKFTNAESVAEFIIDIAKETSLSRIIFLFDEAAHTFDADQQKIFFGFFKLLHGSIISVKAATYPGITSYGGEFEIGQDAVRLIINSFEENLQSNRDELREHFREMLRKRVPSSDFKKMIQNGEALDLLILLSHGSPRAFLQTVSKWFQGTRLTKQNALVASNNYVLNELTSYHLGLKERLPRFASHIELGMALVKSHLVPEIQKKNEGKGNDPKVQTVYFTIDSLVPHKILRAISLLEYSGFLSQKGVVKTWGRKTAPRYALNLGVAAGEKVFNSFFSANPDEAIKRITISDYREFYSSDSRFERLIDNYQEQESCINGHPRQVDGAFCPLCGAKFEVDTVIIKLLEDSPEKLSITSFLKRKLQDEFQAQTIRDVLELTESDLQRANRIGPIRSRIIVNAAEEYISG